jgi:DNA-directed RNA polymerase specialized sigma subunit
MATVTHLAVEALRKSRQRPPSPENVSEMVAILSSLSDRDRLALVSFYSEAENPKRICRRLGMSLFQFSALRSRVRTLYLERTGKLLLDPSIPSADAQVLQ